MGRTRKYPERNVAFDEVAQALHANCYSPIPLHGKDAAITKWPALFCDGRPSLQELHRYGVGVWGGRQLNNVGVACYGGLVIVDLDSDGPEVRTRLLEIAPDLAKAPCVVGSRGGKFFVRSEDGINHREWNLKGGKVEVLAWRCQGVLPPSTHPKTGREYRWGDGARTLLTTPISQLPVITAVQVAAVRGAFYPSKAKAHKETKAKAARERVEKRIGNLPRWQGPSDEEFRRVADAIAALDPTNRDDWLLVASVAYTFTEGAAEGRALFDAFSGGGEFMGVKFRGCPEKFNATVTQDEQWRLSAGTPIGIGALFDRAGKKGWDLTLKRFPSLGANFRISGPRPKCSGSVADAAAAMPKGPLLREALWVVGIYAHCQMNLTPRALKVFQGLLRYINAKEGFAWVGNKHLAEYVGVSDRALSEALTELLQAGLIVRGNKQNPQGRQTPATAITLPGGLTWEKLLEDDRIAIGHTPATATVGATQADQDHTPNEGSSVHRRGEDHPSMQVRPVHQEREQNAGDPSIEGSTYSLMGGDGGVGGAPAGATAIAQRTQSEWFVSHALPEPVAEFLADEAGLKAVGLIFGVLDRGRGLGATDTTIYRVLDRSWERPSKGPAGSMVPLLQFAPHKVAGTLLERLIIGLEDAGIRLPEAAEIRRRWSSAGGRPQIVKAPDPIRSWDRSGVRNEYEARQQGVDDGWPGPRHDDPDVERMAS